MPQRRPPEVLLTAVWQLLWGLIWVVQAFEFDHALIRLGCGYMALLHLRSAWGLYFLHDWGRQGALQLAGFDLLGVVIRLLGGHISPLGALLQLGMPLYTLDALTDSETRQVFS